MNKYLLGIIAVVALGFTAELAINYGLDSTAVSFATIIVAMAVGMTIFRNAR